MYHARILSFADLDTNVTKSPLDVGSFDNAPTFSPNKHCEDVIPRSPNSRMSKKGNYCSEVLTDKGAGLDSRLHTLRMLLYDEILSIIETGKPKSLYFEVHAMVQLLCVAKRGEAPKLRQYTLKVIDEAIEGQFWPQLYQSFLQVVDKNSKANVKPLYTFLGRNEPMSTTNSSSATDSTTDDEHKNLLSWLGTSLEISTILKEWIARIELVDTLLGHPYISARTKTPTLAAYSLQRVVEKIMSMTVNGALTVLLLELLLKDALTYFLDNIDSVTFQDYEESASSNNLNPSVIELNGGALILHEFNNEFEKMTLRPRLNNESNRLVVQNLIDSRSLFLTFALFGDANSISQSIDERVGFLIPSGLTKIQRAIRKDPATYLRKSYYILLDIAKYLRYIGISAAKCDSVIRSVVWCHMLRDFAEHISESFADLIKPEHWPCLRGIERLIVTLEPTFSTNLTSILQYAWQKYVELQTLKRVGEVEVITSLTSLQNELFAISKNAFLSVKFQEKIKVGMRSVLSSQEVSNRVTKQLLRFCVPSNRQSASKLEEDEDKSWIDDALLVFQLFPDKDGFAISYSRELMRRLLNSKPLSLNAEQKLVDGMVTIVGETEGTAKLRRMLTEYANAMLQYQHLSVGCNKQNSIEFSALVFDKHSWPEMPNSNANLKVPPALALVLTLFEAQYASDGDKKNKRKLDWSNYALHQLTIGVEFDTGPKDLVLNLFQATVLLTFKKCNSSTIAQIAQLCGVSEDFAIKIVCSLSTKKYPILKLLGQDVRFNSAFENEATEIRIPMIREKERVAELSNKVMATGRRTQLRSAIVREMKARRKAPYLECIAVIVEKFEWVSVTDLKKVVENLITDGFLEREKNGTDLRYIP